MHHRLFTVALVGILSTIALARADVFEVTRGGGLLLVRGVAPPSNARSAESSLGTPQYYRSDLLSAADAADLSPALLSALVAEESGWRASTVSSKGAIGLTQLMPQTARALSVDPKDPSENLKGGAMYLREQLDRFGGRLDMALAAYNAGPDRVRKAGGIPRIPETQEYVAAILERLADAAKEKEQAQ